MDHVKDVKSPSGSTERIALTLLRSTSHMARKVATRLYVVYPPFAKGMPAPYTIEQVADASGLSTKFVRRLRGALPRLFEKHTERGGANALLFDEAILEILKRTRELKNRGRSLKQMREELSALVGKEKNATRQDPHVIPNSTSPEFLEERSAYRGTRVWAAQHDIGGYAERGDDPMKAALERENALLRSQVDLLQNLLRKAEERFDRLLPMTTASASDMQAGTTQGPSSKKENLKAQLLLWLVEAVVVTTFATGFIFLIWFFAQKAFKI